MRFSKPFGSTDQSGLASPAAQVRAPERATGEGLDGLEEGQETAGGSSIRGAKRLRGA